MEIRCDTCDHVGAPSGVLPGADGGVVMVCASCGAQNAVRLTDELARDEAPAPKRHVEPTSLPPKANSSDGAEETKPDLAQTAFERLIPERGEGFRCPKCIRIITPDFEHCPYCGLQLSEGVRHARGSDSPWSAPWERAPEGKDSEVEQANLLWAVTEDDPSELNFDYFVDFTDEHELWELQIRRLRWFLVDHPDHESALSHLRSVANAFQSRVIIAESTSKARARHFEDNAVRFRLYLMIGAAVFWTILVIIVSVLFFKSR